MKTEKHVQPCSDSLQIRQADGTQSRGRKSRKIVAVLLAMLMIFGMMPLSVSAADLASVPDGGIGFNYGDNDFLLITMPTTEGYYTYGQWGAWDTEETAVNVASLPASNWDWEWAVQKEAGGYRMILNGVTGDYAASTPCDGLLYKCDLTLELRGNNSLKMKAFDSPDNAAIRGVGDLTIEGAGSLKLISFWNCPARGLEVDGTVTISGGKVIIHAEQDAIVADSLQFGNGVYVLAGENSDGADAQEYIGGSLSGKKYLQTAYAASGTSFTVSFSPAGGTGTMTNVTNVVGAYTLPPNSFTAPVGMQFEAWEIDYEEYAVGDTILVTSDTTLTAVWEDDPNTFQVSFYRNGGSGSMEDAKGIVGSYTLPANGFTAPEGKQFKGWSVNNTEYAVGETINVTSNTTVYAVWEDDPNTIAVHFDSNGGSGYMASKADTSTFDYILPGNGFSSPYYVGKFGGWLVNGIVKQPGDTITVTEDITVKALWNYLTVGGVAVTSENTDNVTSSSITAGMVSYDPLTQTLTLNNATIYSTFLGGTMTSAISTGFYFDGTLTINLVGNNTIYGDLVTGPASSSHRYAIDVDDLGFKGNGSLMVTASEAGSGGHYYAIHSGNNIKVESGCTITAIAKPQGTSYCSALSYGGALIANGSTILGSTSETGTPVAAFRELGNAAKYAKILPAYNVTVSFAAGDGTGTMADQSVVCGDEYALPTSGFTAPSGKQFKAWLVNSSEKNVGDIVYFVEDTTITAVWEDAHICNLQPVEKDWPTCTDGGKEAYYKCNCGKYYEDANGTIEIPDIATWGNLPRLDHTPSGWKHDQTKHWKECTNANCGIVIDGTEAAHTSTGSNAATCQTAAVCDECGESYGTVGTHDPENTLSKDATGHWYVCKTSGCTEKVGFAAHTPDHQGNATEEYPILCTDCGWTIEEQLTHTHVFDEEVVADRYKESGATCTEPAKYYKSCACGEKGTETFESGTSNGHTHGTEWKSDEDNHWNECACGDKANTAAHKDENTDGKCDVCTHPVETSSDIPATGENSTIALWFALLLVSSGALITMTFANRKRKNVR